MCNPLLHSTRQMRAVIRRGAHKPSGKNLRKILMWYLRCCNAWTAKNQPYLPDRRQGVARNARYDGELHFTRETARNFIKEEVYRQIVFIACSWPVNGRLVAR